MADNIKDLQQLAEANGGATTLDWSTISHTHGGGAAVASNAVDPAEAINLVKQLQQLPQPENATTMEWSTISHTHGGGAT